MPYEIDQSGKIENTSKNTIICLSNGKTITLLLKAKDKRKLQEIFRRNGQNRNYVLFSFSAVISLILKDFRNHELVTIDREYFGKEAIIKEIISEMIKTNKIKPEIVFDLVGKDSNSHKFAYKVATNQVKPTIVVRSEEVLREIKKTEVGKRLKNA